MTTEWEAKPWMPLVIDKWRGSPTVRSMSYAEQICYLNLLMAQWQQPDGMLPNDEKQLRKYSMMGPDWDAVKAAVLDEFDAMGNGRIANVKQYIEWQRVEEMGSERAESGRKGGLAKASKRVAKASTATVLLEQTPSKPVAKASDQQQQQQQQEQQTSDDSRLDVLIERLACAHPKSREKMLQPIDLTPAAIAAVSQAIVSEASQLGVTMTEAATVMLDVVLEITKQTPASQVRYVPNLETFYRNRDYRRPADSWSGHAAGNGNHRTKSDGNLAELRDLIGPVPAVDQHATRRDSDSAPGDDRQGRVPPVLEGVSGLPATGHRSSSSGAMQDAAP